MTNKELKKLQRYVVTAAWGALEDYGYVVHSEENDYITVLLKDDGDHMLLLDVRLNLAKVKYELLSPENEE